MIQIPRRSPIFLSALLILSLAGCQVGKDGVLKPVDDIWQEYRNSGLGFSFQIPGHDDTFGEAIVQKDPDHDIFYTTWKSDPVLDRLKAESDARERSASGSFYFLAEKVESEDDLHNYVRQFGQSCWFYKKPHAQEGVYWVYIRKGNEDEVSDPKALCRPLATHFLYSPQGQLLLSWKVFPNVSKFTVEGESLDSEVLHRIRFLNRPQADAALGEFSYLNESGDYDHPHYGFGFHLPEDWEIRSNPPYVSPTTDLILAGPKAYPDLLFSIAPVLTSKSPQEWYREWGGPVGAQEVRRLGERDVNYFSHQANAVAIHDYLLAEGGVMLVFSHRQLLELPQEFDRQVLPVDVQDSLLRQFEGLISSVRFK